MSKLGRISQGAVLLTLACGSSNGGSSNGGSNNGGSSNAGSSNSGGSNGVGGVPLAEAGAWRVATSEGAPSPRVGHSLVWTGSEYIVWGGAAIVNEGATELVADGGRYDRQNDSWTPTSETAAPTPRVGHKAAWTGSQMAIIGQDVDVFPTQPLEGFLYDPKADSWTPMTTMGAPATRAYYDVVSVDGKVVVWGGWLSAGMGTDAFPAASGGVYDPELDSWTPIATEGAPLYDGGHVTLAIEGGFVTYGALSHFLGADAGHMLAARYELGTEQWTELDDVSDLNPSQGFTSSVIQEGSLLSVAASADGAGCLLLSLPVDGSFTSEELAQGGAHCPTVIRQPPLLANGKLVTLDSQLLLELDSPAVFAVSPAPMAALTEGRVPAGFTFGTWNDGVAASDGQEIFVFGGIVQASEGDYDCPPGAPCAAPAQMDVGVSGGLFTP